MSNDIPEVQPIVPDCWTASTNLNPSIKTYSDLAHRVKVRLGYPTIDVNVSDESIANSINEALEHYTRYAGYDEEYIIFCDSVLDDGCEVKLDDLVDSCYSKGYGETLSSEDSLRYETYISATHVENHLIGTAPSLINQSTLIEETTSEAVNIPTEKTITSRLELKYDPSQPWTFDVCDANKVTIEPLSAYPPQQEHSALIDAWISVEDGTAEIYPPNWEEKDPCMSDGDWWDILHLSGWTPKNATHVIVSGVPNCTISGLHPLEINTGKGATFEVCDKTLSTDGYIPATVKFVDDYNLPIELNTTFDVDHNSGFKLVLDQPYCSSPNTPVDVPVVASFYESLSSFEYGQNVVSCEGFIDESLDNNQRKVVDVFSVDPTGEHSGELLFNFEYAFAEGVFGYNGMGNRFRQSGYDLVTYDISRQYIETVERMFGSSNISFKYNKRTQKLRVFKNNYSYCNSNSCYLLGLYLERRVEDMISEMWVQDYVTALTKITMGNTLSRFGGATTIGGLTINGNDILTQGLDEKEKLLIWLREQNSEGGLSVPFYME